MLDWPSSVPHVHQLEVVGKILSPRFRDPSSQHTVGKGYFPKRKWDTVRKREWVRSGYQIQMSSSSWTSKTKVCILSFPIPAWYRQRLLISGDFVLLLPETFSNVWRHFWLLERSVLNDGISQWLRFQGLESRLPEFETWFTNITWVTFEQITSLCFHCFVYNMELKQYLLHILVVMIKWDSSR